ncbi:hypothetical protein A0H81_12596 [Grifola frondosa]|uniref:Uncharacterized protein n=1 Tax=Grifola frondosa TaxID=5627 RepID=A0A1C7LU56_GRIFR|nr:hypothetical protein A0H81_12596 [Grifola frondosa]
MPNEATESSELSNSQRGHTNAHGVPRRIPSLSSMADRVAALYRYFRGRPQEEQDAVATILDQTLTPLEESMTESSGEPSAGPSAPAGVQHNTIQLPSPPTSSRDSNEPADESLALSSTPSNPPVTSDPGGVQHGTTPPRQSEAMPSDPIRGGSPTSGSHVAATTVPQPAPQEPPVPSQSSSSMGPIVPPQSHTDTASEAVTPSGANASAPALQAQPAPQAPPPAYVIDPRRALRRQGAFYDRSHPDIAWMPEWGPRPNVPRTQLRGMEFTQAEEDAAPEWDEAWGSRPLLTDIPHNAVISHWLRDQGLNRTQVLAGLLAIRRQMVEQHERRRRRRTRSAHTVPVLHILNTSAWRREEDWEGGIAPVENPHPPARADDAADSQAEELDHLEDTFLEDSGNLENLNEEIRQYSRRREDVDETPVVGTSMSTGAGQPSSLSSPRRKRARDEGEEEDREVVRRRLDTGALPASTSRAVTSGIDRSPSPPTPPPSRIEDEALAAAPLSSLASFITRKRARGEDDTEVQAGQLTERPAVRPRLDAAMLPPPVPDVSAGPVDPPTTPSPAQLHVPVNVFDRTDLPLPPPSSDESVPHSIRRRQGQLRGVYADTYNPPPLPEENAGESHDQPRDHVEPTPHAGPSRHVPCLPPPEEDEDVADEPVMGPPTATAPSTQARNKRKANAKAKGKGKGKKRSH